MPLPDLDAAARLVLGQFVLAEPGGTGVPPGPRPTPLGNHGGFSGARLWRCEGPAGVYCLRAWPAGDPSPRRLGLLHELMVLARRAGLSFVPEVFAARTGATWIEHQGRLWELTHWLPGKADFHAHPTPQRLRAACRALAQLHVVWQRAHSGHGSCPAVERRLRTSGEWQRLVRSGWQPCFRAGGTEALDPWAERAWRLLPGWVTRLPVLLAPWQDRPMPLQPCLCDVWHDHLLFEGDELTGLIDYGGVKTDHIAVDLARLLGSLAGDDGERWEVGLAAYREVRPLSVEEEALAMLLDRTGTVLGAANWLRWVYHDGRRFDDLRAAAQRLAALVKRLERWPS